MLQRSAASHLQQRRGWPRLQCPAAWLWAAAPKTCSSAPLHHTAVPLCAGLHLCAASAPPLRRLCAASAPPVSPPHRAGVEMPNPNPDLNPNPNQAWRSLPRMAAPSSSCLPASGCSSSSRSSRWRSPTSEAVSCLGPWSFVLLIYRRRVAACRGWGCAHPPWLPRCGPAADAS